jgi:protein-disulfide isomerase
MHKDAMGAHLAAAAAGKQDKFWELHDRLFANQEQLNLDAYKTYARELGLDVARFEKDLGDLGVKRAVEDDKAEARLLGVGGTPGFFVNGRFLGGARPFADFAQAIDAELARLNVPTPPGAPGS